MHKKGYFHRDLKPENLVLREDNLLKLTDFGIIKEAAAIQLGPFTEYVSTRWYRAPELILKSTRYDYKIDIFAIGCIMAELYLLVPLFPGSSDMDQLNKVIQVLGTPEMSEWYDGYQLAENKGINIPQDFPKKDMKSIFRNACPEAISLMESLL